MTIEELRARKRELLARKRHELELQARGEGDNLALFMVREELGDVNDQLRALTAGRRQRGGQTAADYTKDRQQYLDWRREDTALDGEIDEGRARLTAAGTSPRLPGTWESTSPPSPGALPRRRRSCGRRRRGP